MCLFCSVTAMSLLVNTISDYYILILVGIVISFIAHSWLGHRKYLEKLKWARSVPGLPVIGCILELGDPVAILKVFSDYCRRYNGLCRMNLFGKQFILLSDYKYMNHMITDYTNMEKNAPYKFLKNWLGTSILTSEGTRWKNRRKTLAPAFHFTVLEPFMEVFESNAKILEKLLEKEVGKSSVDIFPYITMCSLDNICESAMGVSINAQTDNLSEYVFAVKEMLRITITRTFSPIKRSDILYPLTRDYYKEKKYVKILHSKTNSVISTRRKQLIEENGKEQESSQADEQLGVKKRMAFLDLMLHVTIDGKPMSDKEIRQEVDTFMFAASDTTSSAMSFMIYCLAEHPEHQEELAKELEHIFSDDKNRSITSQDLQNMKYLDMVVKETLRLYPSAVFLGRILNKEIQLEDGKILPKGLNVIPFIYGAHRNPEVFPDPEKFDPLRFDDGKRYPPYSYIPFGAGPRNCIGRKFALMEMKATVAQLLRKFEFVSCGHELILAAEGILISKNGVKISLRLRE